MIAVVRRGRISYRGSRQGVAVDRAASAHGSRNGGFPSGLVDVKMDVSSEDSFFWICFTKGDEGPGAVDLWYEPDPVLAWVHVVKTHCLFMQQ